MKRSEFHVSKMDCPSEERLIRMALEGNVEYHSLKFDLFRRNLTVVHKDDPERILSLLNPLRLGAELRATTEAEAVERTLEDNDDLSELSVLKKVFAINAVMFVVGFFGGLVAQSKGLIADSMDMFADAAVFALSIYAVGKTVERKRTAARVSGYLQMVLAVFALSEVIRRYLYGSEPRAQFMMALAALALIANAVSMFLLAKHKDKEVHMKASWIFLSNDIIANAGVIIAGALVWLLRSQVPDLMIGTIIAFVVFTGSVRILRAAKS